MIKIVCERCNASEPVKDITNDAMPVGWSKAADTTTLCPACNGSLKTDEGTGEAVAIQGVLDAMDRAIVEILKTDKAAKYLRVRKLAEQAVGIRQMQASKVGDILGDGDDEAEADYGIGRHLGRYALRANDGVDNQRELIMGAMDMIRNPPVHPSAEMANVAATLAHMPEDSPSRPKLEARVAALLEKIAPESAEPTAPEETQETT